MTSQQQSFKLAPPKKVYDCYKAILACDLITKKALDTKYVAEFQNFLNESQPSNDEEHTTRSLIQFLYRKNPNNFIKFLIRSHLNHLILWTEAKCIVRHFDLQGVLYVKWNEHQYDCNIHYDANSNSANNTNHAPRARYSSNWGDSNQSHEYNNNQYSQNNGYGKGRGKGRGKGNSRDYRDRNGKGSRYNEDFPNMFEQLRQVDAPDDNQPNPVDTTSN